MVDEAGSSEAAARSWAILLGALAAVLFLLAYFRAPFQDVDTLDLAAFAVLFLGALTLSVILYVYALPKLDNARRPLLQALMLILLFAEFYLLSFAFVYFVMATSGQPGDDFDGLVTRVDALYFAVSTFTTVGFGDVTPAGQTARALVTVQQVVNLAVLGVLVRVTTRRVTRVVEARRATP